MAPSRAARAPVVYDSGFDDRLAFLCGTKQLTASYCPDIARDPSDLNTASIAIGDLVGAQTVTRTATNVSGKALSLRGTVTGMSGVDVTVSPQTLSLAPGATATYSVTFTRDSAPVGAHTGGQLTWADGTSSARIPLVVRPVALSAPSCRTFCSLHG